MASLTFQSELKNSTVAGYSTYPPARLISAATLCARDSLISPSTSLALHQGGWTVTFLSEGDILVLGTLERCFSSDARSPAWKIVG